MTRIAVIVLATTLTACGAPAAPNAAGQHERRVEVVQMVEAGELTERDELGRVLLPPDYADLSSIGRVGVRDDPLMVFFTTWTGFSPDPYCGYEYSADASSVVVDPLGSGRAEVEPLGDGWYWICAR